MMLEIRKFSGILRAAHAEVKGFLRQYSWLIFDWMGLLLLGMTLFMFLKAMSIIDPPDPTPWQVGAMISLTAISLYYRIRLDFHKEISKLESRMHRDMSRLDSRLSRVEAKLEPSS